jgi:hypothetical protein
MRQQWLRAGDTTPACWACFVIFDEHVDVLAVTGPNQRLDRTITPDAARALWNELRQGGWYRAITIIRSSRRRLRVIAYR